MKIACTSLFCLLVCAGRAAAQFPPPAGIAPVPDASIGFSSLIRAASPAGRIALNGVTASATEDFPGRHGLMVEVSYLRASNVFGSGHSNDVLSYMMGPVFYPARRRDFVVNLHVLGGGARVAGVVPLSTGALDIGHVHTIAWAFGGGVEHWFSDTMALRISADALHTSFFNSSGVVSGQYDLRSTVSLVYYFGRHKGKRH